MSLLQIPHRPCAMRKAYLHNYLVLTQQRWTSSQIASDKLYVDASREEESEESATKKSACLAYLEAQSQHENWTGDEPIEHAILRMLIDKHRPLRTGTGVQSADQKLKRAPPTVTPAASNVQVNAFDTSRSPSTGSWATEPLLPSSEEHRPWHTTFKVPSPSVRLGHGLAPRKDVTASSQAVDDRTRNLERQAKKRTERAGRLMSARESTLDYRLGIRGSRMQAHDHGNAPKEPGPGRVHPVSMKAWTNLVEERIEKARLAGQFKNVQGRGKPLVRHHSETNPFIAREEFLLNRIVQKNGAAPPWVELQHELDTALTSFREILKQSWVRRALRTLGLSDPSLPADISLPPPTLSILSSSPSLRRAQTTWETQERSYHDAAVGELNNLVRKYNGLAPYAVRRTPYTREGELERLYRDAAPDIVEGLKLRAGQLSKGHGKVRGVSEDGEGGGPAGEDTAPLKQYWGPSWLRDVFRRFLERVSAHWVRHGT
ncbi:hypothetical protein HGRIS_008628 [Hohenbuehelia grisea]|uniref:DnaJ homologue subfamily C member 28 conserved domain-containing protein n=1 Tax=Hohenbuehelia grisea TaxID=104357 RepID=A0ABR3J917_9AGAR